MDTARDISNQKASALSTPHPVDESHRKNGKITSRSETAKNRPPSRKGAVSPAKGAGLLPFIALVDILIVSSALIIGWWIRFDTRLSELGRVVDEGLSIREYAGHIVIGSALMFGCLIKFKAYDFSQLLRATAELKIVFRATVAWLVAFLALMLVLRIEPEVSRMHCLLGAGCIFLLLSYWRVVLANYLIPLVSDSWLRKVVIVGWNDDARKLVKNMNRSRSPEFNIVGILIPDDVKESELPRIPGEISVLGTIEQLEDVMENIQTDGVMVTELPPAELNHIASLCEREMVSFQMIPNCFPSLLSGLKLDNLYGVPVLGVTRLPLQRSFNSAIKRCIDLVGAIVGLILSIPLITLFGLLIYSESRGNIFYRQNRLGLYGREFSLIKLRSMKLDSEKDGKAGWTVKDDPRCLKIGKFIRKWNIDEVPQFWNVIKGEMSLVGPRPERPELIENFKGEIPHYNARHTVKPGITGWAQINGLRGDTDLTERVKHDLHYIESWTPWFDFYIMFRTFFARKGAC